MWTVFDELFNPPEEKKPQLNDCSGSDAFSIYDELFNPPKKKEVGPNDVSETRSVESSMFELRERLKIIEE